MAATQGRQPAAELELQRVGSLEAALEMKPGRRQGDSLEELPEGSRVALQEDLPAHLLEEIPGDWLEVLLEDSLVGSLEA